MEVRRLKLLRELSARGTIAATAQASSLTPSAVSQQLSLLEREVRTPLLIRDGRRVRLTRAAEVLVRHTEDVLASLEEAKAEVAALSGDVRGTVRLAAFPTAASALVPGALAACASRHPDVRVLLSEYEPAAAVAAVRSGELDLALVFEYSLLPEIRARGVKRVPILTESLLAVVPPDFQPHTRNLRLADLADQRWVAPDSDHLHRAMLERACAVAGFTPRLEYATDDYTVMLALAQAGLCVTLVPELAVEFLTTDVRLLPVAELDLRREVSVVIRTGSETDPVISAVLTALTEAATARG